MVTENRPIKNNTTPKMAKSPIDGVARTSIIGGVPRAIPRQSSHAPPASMMNSKTAKPGTKNFSNCSRVRRAGKISPSFVSNRDDSPRVRDSSSNSSFSNRSFSSSRIWNQLAKAMRTVIKRKIEAPTPASELTKQVTANVATKMNTAVIKFTKPFFGTCWSTGIINESA